VRAPDGHYNACASDETDDPDLTFDDVLASLEAASD
jgi:hypothetical protein